VRKKSIAIHVLAVLSLIMIIWPFLWMVSTAFRGREAMFAVPPEWIPKHPTLHALRIVLSPEQPMLVWFRNSTVVGLVTAVGCLGLGIPAGYAFSRFRFRGSTVILMLIVASQMFPLILVLIALYLLYRDLGLLNTLPGLALAFMAFSLPFSIWMLKNYFDTVPRELEEAARIDGCGRLGALVRVVLPLMKPAVVSVGIFSFLVAWNDVLFAATLNTSDPVRTIAPGLLMRYGGLYQSRYDEMMAASFLTTLPILVVFVLLQRYVVAGLTLGAVKG